MGSGGEGWRKVRVGTVFEAEAGPSFCRDVVLGGDIVRHNV